MKISKELRAAIKVAFEAQAQSRMPSYNAAEKRGIRLFLRKHHNGRKITGLAETMKALRKESNKLHQKRKKASNALQRLGFYVDYHGHLQLSSSILARRAGLVVEVADTCLQSTLAAILAATPAKGEKLLAELGINWS